MSTQGTNHRMTDTSGTGPVAGRGGNRCARPLRLLLALASFATAAVALWLVFVTATVLPTRDPGHVTLWRGVAAGFIVYSAVTWAYLLRAERAAWLRGPLMLLSLGAVVLGAYGIGSMVRVAQSGGDFEGYIVLMGLILGGHGLTALLYTSLARRAAGAG